jgi:hypothetical protein
MVERLLRSALEICSPSIKQQIYIYLVSTPAYLTIYLPSAAAGRALCQSTQYYGKQTIQKRDLRNLKEGAKNWKKEEGRVW